MRLDAHLHECDDGRTRRAARAEHGHDLTRRVDFARTQQRDHRADVRIRRIRIAVAKRDDICRSDQAGLIGDGVGRGQRPWPYAARSRSSVEVFPRIGKRASNASGVSSRPRYESGTPRRHARSAAKISASANARSADRRRRSVSYTHRRRIPPLRLAQLLQSVKTTDAKSPRSRIFDVTGELAPYAADRERPLQADDRPAFHPSRRAAARRRSRRTHRPLRSHRTAESRKPRHEHGDAISLSFTRNSRAPRTSVVPAAYAATMPEQRNSSRIAGTSACFDRNRLQRSRRAIRSAHRFGFFGITVVVMSAPMRPVRRRSQARRLGWMWWTVMYCSARWRRPPARMPAADGSPGT